MSKWHSGRLANPLTGIRIGTETPISSVIAMSAGRAGTEISPRSMYTKSSQSTGKKVNAND